MSLVEKVTWKSGVDTSEIIESKVQELVDSGTIGVEGWSVVKTGIAVLPSLTSGGYENVAVDISDLGFASGEDYYVIATLGASTGWGAITFCVHQKQADTFNFRFTNKDTVTRENCNVNYAIIAKSSAVVKTMEEDSGWIKPNGDETIKCRRVGKLCEIRINNYKFETALANNASKAIATLPDDFKIDVANNTVYSVGVTSDWKYNPVIYIGSNGLSVRNQTGATISDVFGTLVYYAD